MNAPKTPAAAGPTGSGKASASKKRYHWKPWKIAVVVFAGLLVVGGGALAFTSADAEPAATSGSPGFDGAGPGGTGGPETARSLTGGSPSGTGIGGRFEIGVTGEPTVENSWSPALLRGGVSFFVAFCLAFALRAFLRLAAIFIGIWALSVFLMSQADWVTVHWTTIDSQFTSWTHGLGAQFASFQTFIKGSLPSSGLAGLGLFTGFKAR